MELEHSGLADITDMIDSSLFHIINFVSVSI